MRYEERRRSRRRALRVGKFYRATLFAVLGTDAAPVDRDEATDEVENEEGRQQWFRNMWEDDTPQTPDKQQPPEEEDRPDEDGEDGFGDDFDEFAEGEEHDDFGDFDQAEDETSQIPTSTLSTAHDTLSGLVSIQQCSLMAIHTLTFCPLLFQPPLNLSTCTTSAEIEEAITPYINAILPNSTPVISKSDATPIDASHFPAFQSERSLSLWQQLVSPPPMQPPDWTRSRIRRLFLVSLGVPVDLDEILPPSKQKRLILPSIGLDGDARPGSAIDRLRERGGGNESSTSLDSKTGAPKKSRRAAAPTSQKGPLPPPDFDLNAATLLCSTTVEALSVYSDPELKDHVFTLEILNKKASTVLEYWLQRVDESLKEKEALEGVIENLVGFVKGRRGK